MSNNPIANEGLLSKIKTKIGKKEEGSSVTTGKIDAYLLGINNAMNICANACACCWDKEIPDDYQGQAEYVAKRSRIGHTSVLEHSNFVVYLNVDNAYTDELVDFLDICNYLHTRSVKSSDGDSWHVVIGGSYRGYCDLYRETDDLNNPVLKAITSILYTYAHSGAFEDICKLGLMEKDRFLNVEPDENFNILSKFDSIIEEELFTVMGIDSLSKLYTNLYNISKDAASKITTFDMIKFATVSIMFKNMSRTCTHQLVRHRNAITQESQRYVDYSKSCFSSPADFKPDRYDADHKYTVRFGPSSQMHLTLAEIGQAMCDIYSQLYNPAIAGNDYALMREDARAFLPSNVQCRKIYMTFTYKSLLKFLDLREDKAAQAEIRMYAVALGTWFRSHTEFETAEICTTYLQPRLLIQDPFNIDIDEGIVEEQVEMTEEDYIRASGLDKEDGTETTTEE